MATPAAATTGCDETTDRRQQVRRALVAYHESRDGEALNLIVNAYQGLAYSLASRFAQRGEDIEDLNQVALIGLLKAIERFDPARGTELTTFATATILGELKRHLRDRGWWVRPPRRVHDLYISTQQAIDDLTQRYGRSPTVAEVAALHRRSPVEEVVEALDAGGLRNSAPLDTIGSSGDDVYVSRKLGMKDSGLGRGGGAAAVEPPFGPALRAGPVDHQPSLRGGLVADPDRDARRRQSDAGVADVGSQPRPASGVVGARETVGGDRRPTAAHERRRQVPVGRLRSSRLNSALATLVDELSEVPRVRP